MDNQTPLTASNNQGNKLVDRLRTALEKSDLTREKVQAALEFPGTGLENEMAQAIIKYSKKAAGIETPVSAFATGLVPDDWTVEKDSFGKDIELSKVSFDCRVCKQSYYIKGSAVIELAAASSIQSGLGFAKIILDEQAAGRQVIPTGLRFKIALLFPRTVLRDLDGDRRFPALYMDKKDDEWKWKLAFDYLGDNYDSYYAVPQIM